MGSGFYNTPDSIVLGLKVYKNRGVVSLTDRWIFQMLRIFLPFSDVNEGKPAFLFMCHMIAGSCIQQEVIRLLQRTSAALKAVSGEQKWITVSERLQIKAWVVDENWISQSSEHQTLLLSEEDAHAAKQPIRHLVCSLNQHLSVWAIKPLKVNLTSRTSADSLPVCRFTRL